MKAETVKRARHHTIRSFTPRNRSPRSHHRFIKIPFVSDVLSLTIRPLATDGQNRIGNLRAEEDL